jgi:branched-chain amino acid aminotransferase
MLEDRVVYRNGEMIPWNQATVHLMSHSFGRGSAIFEFLSVHETKTGPVTGQLSSLMGDILAGEQDRFKDWLFPVFPS